MAVGPFGTGFAQSNFSFDPNISPNNQAFGQAVIAVVRRSGVGGTGGTGGGGTGSVTSVGLTEDGGTGLFTITGSPVTTAGVIDLELQNQAANTVFAGPVSGAAARPAFRALTGTDMPSGLGCKITVFTNAIQTSTWIPAPGTVLVDVVCIAGGGAGGGGAGGVSPAAAGGGGGGGGGGVSIARYDASVLGGSQIVTFSGTRATGGFGGTGNANGTAGGAGASCQFGNLLTAYGGTKGNGASGASGGGLGAAGVGKDQTGGAGGAGAGANGNGGNASNLTNTALQVANYCPTGGGGGGCVNTNATILSNGGTGGAGVTGPGNGFIVVAGGTGGTGTGAAGGPGNTSGGFASPASGGGGGSAGAGAVFGGNGGQGADYGAGGGGGGGGNSTAGGGRGGAGGAAAVIVFEWGNGVSGISPGNPTSLVSTTGTNGTSVNYMRQDAAPAIDQAMVPTWTGRHAFNASPIALAVGTGNQYAWGGGTQFGPVAQMGMSGGIGGEVASVTLRLWSGGYWNGTNQIYTGTNTNNTGTSTIANVVVGQGQFLVQWGAPGTFGGTCTTLTNIFSVTGTTSPVVRAWGPTAAGFVDMTPDSGTFVGTYLGLTVAQTGTAFWSRNGNQVTLGLPFGTGSSNATTLTFGPLPAAILPARTQFATLNLLQNNSAFVTGVVQIVASNGTATFLQGAGGAAWTNAGAKSVGASGALLNLSYLLN